MSMRKFNKKIVNEVAKETIRHIDNHYSGIITKSYVLESLKRNKNFRNAIYDMINYVKKNEDGFREIINNTGEGE